MNKQQLNSLYIKLSKNPDSVEELTKEQFEEIENFIQNRIETSSSSDLDSTDKDFLAKLREKREWSIIPNPNIKLEWDIQNFRNSNEYPMNTDLFKFCIEQLDTYAENGMEGRETEVNKQTEYFEKLNADSSRYTNVYSELDYWEEQRLIIYDCFCVYLREKFGTVSMIHLEKRLYALWNEVLKRIEKIEKDIKEHPIAIPEPEEEILFVSDIEKIALIYELGIIDFIKKKQPEHTPRALHQLIYQITEIKTATVKKYIQRIEEHINGTKIETSLVEHFNKAKTMIGKVRETNEILGNKE
jgi:hypothetical protein